jgi:hypothetical protein
VSRRSLEPHRRRGRPQKFGRPSELVPLTLPTDVVRGLRKIDDDVARAIVQLFEMAPSWARESTEDVELASIDDHHSLIVVNPVSVRSLPGIDIIPLEVNRAFLALAPGRSVGDLELAVLDRLSDAGSLIDLRERQALQQLGRQLRAWREDQGLRFEGRAIIVVETTASSRTRDTARQPASVPHAVELVPFGGRRSLIVVNSTIVHGLPGVDLIPLGRGRAFLALAPGRSVSDLELAVIDRAGVTEDAVEREALENIRRQLRAWRQDAALEFHARAIILVETVGPKRTKGKSVNLKNGSEGSRGSGGSKGSEGSRRSKGRFESPEPSEPFRTP